VDIGMGDWSNDRVGQFFRAKAVLDVGSGYEGIARRLHSIFGQSGDAPVVINLNPQFSDWRMKDVYVGGKRKSYRQYKATDLEISIKYAMETFDEDADSYFTKRIAVAGLVQQLPIDNESVDIVTSTWGMPTSFYDCDLDERDFKTGYSEVQRVLKSGGVALLAPLRLGQLRHTKGILDSVLRGQGSYKFTETGERWGGREFVLELTKF